MRLEAPIVRVFRGETWLTVYRSVAVRIRWELVGLGAGQLLFMKKCDGNQQLFVRSQLWSRTRTKGPGLYLNLQL